MSNISIKKHSVEVINKPRITEKAAVASEKGVYTFEVHSSATKASVSKAVKEIYNVTPIKVNIVRNKAKVVFVKGKVGTKRSLKKAYVFLKKGDKIDIA